MGFGVAPIEVMGPVEFFEEELARLAVASRSEQIRVRGAQALGLELLHCTPASRQLRIRGELRAHGHHGAQGSAQSVLQVGVGAAEHRV